MIDARITSEHLRKWLERFDLLGVRVTIDRLPTTGRYIVVTRTAGPGLIREGTAEIIGFNIQVRGGENNFEDAEAIANAIDSAILEYGNEVIEIDGVVIHAVGRTGGGLQTIGVVDSASRYAFSGSYFAEVSTQLGEYV
jgi:hypothetical protein